ncbi:MAG: hypothetical protein U1E17_01195 [Geminicoccaceae bacterium]
MSEMVFQTTSWGNTLFEALLRARHRHGGSYPVLEDTTGVQLTYTKLSVVGALVLGRRLAALTRRASAAGGAGARNVNAAGVLLMALQAFGRGAAWLNFRRPGSALEAAMVTAEIKLVVSSSQFIEQCASCSRRQMPSPSMAASSGSRSCARRSGLRGCAACSSLYARRLHQAFGLRRDDPAAVLFTRPGGAAQGRGPEPRQHPGQLRADRGQGRLQSDRQGSTPCRCSTASA